MGVVAKPANEACPPPPTPRLIKVPAPAPLDRGADLSPGDGVLSDRARRRFA